MLLISMARKSSVQYMKADGALKIFRDLHRNRNNWHMRMGNSGFIVPVTINEDAGYIVPI